MDKIERLRLAHNKQNALLKELILKDGKNEFAHINVDGQLHIEYRILNRKQTILLCNWLKKILREEK